ncbi:hypothetical protein WICMUC_005748 [Wickerhamomyces mucosus]|uniref:DUF3533 domain-containing protein n=1 Tax=Wickerhamomyces mucosus TaxID=1378264 RepID=A0A9P8P2I1_9ASCO|nr:hypothetical protein WICMUC_005748 [Wickerhamomyces mucosus]
MDPLDTTNNKALEVKTNLNSNETVNTDKRSDESQISKIDRKTKPELSSTTSGRNNIDLSSKANKSDVIQSKIQLKKENSKFYWRVTRYFLETYLVMIILFLIIMSIFWGSLYKRTRYYKNLHYLVVLDEGEITTPLVSEVFIKVFNSSQVQNVLGTFNFVNITEFTELSLKKQHTNYEELTEQIHQLNYWGGFYVPPNATLDYFQALQIANSSFNPNELIKFIFETGRDPLTIPSYVLPIIEGIEGNFVEYAQQYITLNLLETLSSTESINLVEKAPNLLSAFWFQYVDRRPNDFGPIIIAITALGLLYADVMSFHQYNFASSIHDTIIKKIKPKQYLIYHILVGQIAYFIMSLIFCLMILAFQVPLTKTFGKSGFLVTWSIVYLTMAALGIVNEHVSLQIFARYKPVIGFWVSGFMVINYTVISSSILLMNRFYRYGYATPMYNGYQLLNVVFFDTYKGFMGRHIGILIAWIVVGNLLLPLTLKNVAYHKKRIEQKAKKALTIIEEKKLKNH